jgi:hypothetical protein
MFDQLPHDRGYEPTWHPVSRLLFMAVLDGKSSTAEGSHAILHHLGDHAALPYDTVETAMKAASMVDTGVADLASLHQRLGEAMAKVGLPATPQQPSPHEGGMVSEFVLVHGVLGESRHAPLARWKLGRA